MTTLHIFFDYHQLNIPCANMSEAYEYANTKVSLHRIRRMQIDNRAIWDRSWDLRSQNAGMRMPK